MQIKKNNLKKCRTCNFKKRQCALDPLTSYATQINISVSVARKWATFLNHSVVKKGEKLGAKNDKK